MKKHLFIVLVLLLFASFGHGQSSDVTCPKIAVVGPPAVILRGDTLIFRAEIENFDRANSLSFSWAVDKGRIIKVEGTAEILVGETEDLGGQSISATLMIAGLPEGCEKRYFDNAIINQPPKCSCWDEFGRLSNDDLRAGLDNLYINLQSDPTATGYIVSYGSRKEVARRHALVRQHVAFRDLDIKKIVLLNWGEEEGIRSIVSIVPAGGDLSTGCCGITPPEKDN